ncbi:MAG: flagellar basal body L-ring protein FlgH [Azospirillaceae bacterium]|nr:flagellar basal body L-ring protein FlgH [Azospirillaceae bacterium]
MFLRPFPLTRWAIVGFTSLGLSGCGSLDRIGDIGKPPDLSPVSDPKSQPGYTPVSLPLPAPQLGEHPENSLWRSGSRSFFKDQRAHRVGDILTVTIAINDSANLSDVTERKRANSESSGFPNMFGLETALPRWLASHSLSTSTLVSTSSSTDNKGTGTIQRSETINLSMAALITQILPNGNMVLQGTQEVMVNYELRALTVTGVIRPEDVTSANKIDYTKIAEARISYGGRGQLNDVQQPRYGTQLLDVILPF